MSATINSDTAIAPESHTTVLSSGPSKSSFSELFPLALYENRDFANLQTSSLIHQQSGKYDVASIAQIGRDAESDAYERVPIEDFGKSVLAKLGWQEGKAIARINMNGNSQGVV